MVLGLFGVQPHETLQKPMLDFGVLFQSTSVDLVVCFSLHPIMSHIGVICSYMIMDNGMRDPGTYITMYIDRDH
jgi:hypothetical protein